MRLIQVLSLVLMQLGTGTLLLSSLLPAREIRLSFFTFNSLFGAVTTGLALVLSRSAFALDWWDLRYLGLTVAGAVVAWRMFAMEKPAAGRWFLVVAGLAGLVGGVVPLANLALKARGLATDARGFFDAGALAGTLLLGTTHVGMVLGHWYLLMRRLSFEYLQRFALLLLGAVGIRIAGVVVTLLWLGRFDHALASRYLPLLWSTDGHLLFFLMRLLWGLATPLILGLFVFRLVQHKANQAATGMLYVIEVSVLFGELFAAYLMI